MGYSSRATPAPAGPPDFAWRTRDVDVPPDAMALSEFTPLLIDFYRQAHLAELWQNSQPAYEKEMAKYHSPIIATTTAISHIRFAIDEWMMFLLMEASNSGHRDGPKW